MRQISRTVVAATSVVVLLAGCSRGEGKTEPQATAATATPTPVPTAAAAPVTPSPTARLGQSRQEAERMVLGAYQQFWDVYSQAVLDLNPAPVESVASGERLQGIRDEIEDLRRRGLAMRVSVTHNPLIIEMSEDSAVVYDEMVNKSFFVNAATKEPRTASGSGMLLRDTYILQRAADGTWKVVSGGRQQ